MSEKFHYNSAQERTDANELNKDFISIGLDNRAHVTGSKKKNGTFVSDHQLRMIEANAGQIYDGMENRENEALLEGIGDSTNPDDIREYLLSEAVIDEDDPLTDEEVLSLVADMKQEVVNYYGKTDEITSGADTPRHRAEYSDSDSPLFDELHAKYRETTEPDPVLEGESIEEFEARQSQKNGGSHRAEQATDEPFSPIPLVDTSKLEAKMNKQPEAGGSVPLVDTSALEARRAAKASTPEGSSPTTPEQDGTAKGAWHNLHERMKSVYNGEALTAATLWFAKRSQKKQETARDDSSNERERRYAKPLMAAGAIAVAFAGGMLAYKYGFDSPKGGSNHTASGGGTGEGMRNIIDSFTDSTPQPPKGGEVLDKVDMNNFKIPKNSGGEALMDQLGVDKSKWYQIQEWFHKRSGNQTYRMDDGNIGFSKPGKLSKPLAHLLTEKLKLRR